MIILYIADRENLGNRNKIEGQKIVKKILPKFRKLLDVEQYMKYLSHFCYKHIFYCIYTLLNHMTYYYYSCNRFY